MLQPLTVVLMGALTVTAPHRAGEPPEAVGPMSPGLSGGATADSVRIEEPRAEVGYDGSAMVLDVAAPLTTKARIRIDGRLDDPAWEGSALLTGFTQYDPVEGAPGSQDTEVRVLVSEDAVYFGILALDEEEDGVRATLTKRDGFGNSDDYVRIILDTFNDGRRGFVFQVNPLGVQGDGIWLEGSGGRGDPIDWNPDFLWESGGVVLEKGYSAELRIPLNSIRFADREIQDWGLQVTRRIQRSGEEAAWAPLSGEKANKLAQSGKLRGLRGLKAGRFAEVNPVFTATRQGYRDSGTSGLRRDDPNGDFGLNLAYGVTSNLTLDATYNPDFSQVESDAGQITVNERFALYLPEKRPFFLEGTDIFSMPRNLVYTRSVVSPQVATKLSGKVGPLSMAYIGAVDEDGGGDAVVNLIRVKRDLGASSSLGMAYTDRSVSGDHFNRVLGVDGRLVLARRYTLDLMAAGSADGLPGETTRWGSLFLARFSRASRSLSMNASFEDVTGDFKARSGFIRRTGSTQLQGRVGYRWRGGPGALVESWGPSVEVDSYWEREAFWAGRSPQETEVQLNLSGSFKGNISGYLSYSRSDFGYSPDAYSGLVSLSTGSVPGESGSGGLVPFLPRQSYFQGLDAVRSRVRISRWEQIRVSFGASWRETPVFDRTGVPADVADAVGGDLNLTLYPTGSLQARVGLRHSRLLRKLDGSRYSSATIPRLQFRYQFTRSFFVRMVGEYASQTRGDLLDPETGRPLAYCPEDCTVRSGSESHDFSLEGLMAYEPSPGTVVFLGYSRQMRDAGSFQFREVTTQADGLFLKLSYRFRM